MKPAESEKSPILSTMIFRRPVVLQHQKHRRRSRVSKLEPRLATLRYTRPGILTWSTPAKLAPGTDSEDEEASGTDSEEPVSGGSGSG